MRRLLALGAASVMAAGTLLLGPATPAQAQDPDCTTPVVDHSSGKLLSEHDTALQEQITRLQGLGAIVFVRVEENLPDGGDGYKNKMLNACIGWQSHYKGELVLLPNMVLLVYGASVGGDYGNRQTTLYDGHQWIDKGLNQDELLKIRTDTMRPMLLKFDHNNAATFSNVPDGLTLGLKRVADEIKDGVPDNGGPVWLIILFIVIAVVVIGTILAWIFRGSSGGGGYRSGSNHYGGTTIISSTSYGDSGGGYSGGDAGGSTNC